MEGTERQRDTRGSEREIEKESERAVLIPKKGDKHNKHETLCQALKLCVTN